MPNVVFQATQFWKEGINLVGLPQQGQGGAAAAGFEVPVNAAELMAEFHPVEIDELFPAGQDPNSITAYVDSIAPEFSMHSLLRLAMRTPHLLESHIADMVGPKTGADGLLQPGRMHGLQSCNHDFFGGRLMLMKGDGDLVDLEERLSTKQVAAD